MQKTLSVLIIDDEPLAKEILKSYVGKIADLTLVGTCRNVLEAFVILNNQTIDLLLLDINMPEMSGIDFLKQLKNPPMTIFTTAYSEHAVESYELNAVDYLLKPISFERFTKAIQKAVDQFRSHTNRTNHTTPIQNHLLVRSEGKWVRIDLANLWLVEGLKDYVRLWINDERITVHSTMKNFESQLSLHTHFMRIHKSYIVNLNHVSEANHSTMLINGQRLTIGSTYKDEVLKTFPYRKS
ncbi:MAG: response regulator [Bacteroidia bacterium]|jgi:DNA-binding LytR/AlgR family response regulator|nr:response regulator [Bacteroidia bacterium]